jgi:hypothetical protein
MTSSVNMAVAVIVFDVYFGRNLTVRSLARFTSSVAVPMAERISSPHPFAPNDDNLPAA